MAKKEEEKVTLRSNFVPIPLGAELPEHLRDRETRMGFDMVESEDVYTPRLALTQTNTPQRDKNSPQYIEGLEEGDFFHSVKGVRYGPGPLLITPVFMFKSSLKLDGDGGLVCRSEDSRNCSLGKQCDCRVWGPNGERPSCQIMLNFPVILYGDEDFADGLVLSFKSTGIGVAKDWLSKMKATGRDMFAGVWKLWSVPQSDGKYRWYGSQLEAAGWAPPGIFNAAEQLYHNLLKLQKANKLKVDITGVGNEDAGDASFNTTEFDDNL